MRLKPLAAALTLLVGTSLPLMAVAEAPAKAAKRPAASREQASSSGEDVMARTVFQTLLGEIALQRGDVRLGLDAWSDLAQRTRDPKVIARATEVAGLARQYDQALDLAKLWLSIEPESAKARQMHASLLVLANRLDELAPQLTRVLEEDPANLAANLLQLNRILGRIPDKKASQRLIDQLTQPYALLPEAHFARAQAALSAGDEFRALNETEKALQLRPDWEMAAVARAQLQARPAPANAIEGLQRFVQQQPGAREARLMLARLLISERRYDDARTQYTRLLDDAPTAPDALYPAAMLALQQGDAKQGRALLERLLATDYPDKHTLHFFLGQLEEESGQPDAALSHYRQVGGGEQFIVARSRAAQLLQQAGRLEEGRALLHSTAASGNEKVQLLLTEAQLLRNAGQDKEALTLLEAALKRQPDNLELLYDTALLAERTGKPEVLEQRIRHLLHLKPDHPHGLNALGYSLADRGIRLDEAEQLIAKAVRLAPEDPFILDSLGWVFFRQGRHEEALSTLQRAFKMKADPEIAAHLAEVLWTVGRRNEAQRLLSDTLRAHPDNSVLKSTRQKLQP